MIFQDNVIRICRVEKDTELAKELLHFAESCSWTGVREHIAEMLRSWSFTDWETMFAAVQNGRIVGMASLLKTDYYPLPELGPWVSCVFVSEEARGRHISGQLISYANRYAKDLGFKATYIPTEITGLYERFGYRYIGQITNYAGGSDRLYTKEL
ncbi:MAG: GNAT family N-acetyltransferase [Ruminococcus sp.]|nr:GNAT family N-acetyltransferase [Ruminococcus sp.]